MSGWSAMDGGLMFHDFPQAEDNESIRVDQCT